MYNVPSCSASFVSASFTRILVNSESCAAYWLVKFAGMCCTTITDAGKSRVKPGTRRITAAGPPVDAAIAATGNRCPLEFRAWARASRSAGPVASLARFCCAIGMGRAAVRTTRTFAAIRTLRSSSSFTLFMSRSIELEGFPTNSMAPSSNARSVLAAPSFDSELTITMGRGLHDMICSVACRPSMWGIMMSIVITSGLSDFAKATASRPSFARPTTCNCGSELKMFSRTLCMKAESSTTSTRNFLFAPVVIFRSSHWHPGWPGRLRSNQLLDGADQLLLLNRLGQERRRAFLYCPVAVLFARARNPRRRRCCRSPRAPLAGFCPHQGFKVNKENRAPGGRVFLPGKELAPPAVLTEALDHNFVFAENFLDDKPDLPVACVRHDHAEIAVDRLERRQTR